MATVNKRNKAKDELRQSLDDLERLMASGTPRHATVSNLRSAVELKLDGYRSAHERAAGVLGDDDSQRVRWENEYDVLRALAAERLSDSQSWLDGNRDTHQPDTENKEPASEEAPGNSTLNDATKADKAEIERLRRELSKMQETMRRDFNAAKRSHDDQARQQDERSRARDPDTESVHSIQSEGLSQLAETLQRGFSLPQVELPTFSGDALEYSNFICCFETAIETRVSDPRTRLMYLIQQCRGEAKRAIDMCSLISPASKGYREAREILKSLYGNNHHVARACVDKIINGPSIKPSDVKGLANLSLDMKRTSITLSATGYSGDVDNTETLKRLVKRLPQYLRQRWVDVALDIIDDGPMVASHGLPI